jgi:N-acetylglutamate synthase-like GNAT family acetyltransferase
MAVTQTSATTTSRATWDDVIDEVAASCARRAGYGALLDEPGVVGVLAGAAPVVWAHGPIDPVCLADVLASSYEGDEVYVAASQPETVAVLQQRGWRHVETVAQAVHDGPSAPNVVSGLPNVHELQPGDMADVRALLRTHGDVEEELLANSYRNDFFTVAAPVWLFGARDGAGRLVGLVGLRRQGRSAMGFALTVDSDWRSTGLSTALVATAVRRAVAMGAEFVHAQANDRSARRLEDCGFITVGAWHRLVRG